jgi:hypothetical protein
MVTEENIRKTKTIPNIRYGFYKIKFCYKQQTTIIESSLILYSHNYILKNS